ncbi:MULTISPECIES: transporter substrate-binding domain-containing protein [Pandoraea]|uniref:transporter substrate-binding domain-containing protein n=1 Tax=Pandoraea TaxID=93217 RepID=UPI001F5CC400|nr:MULTISPECIES: transporter substrate-binding domain-containing protein [Pandoraea]MCI3206377.1 hypothetical protein [Pandoraea sp. LA3]MDN4584405.1 hypothetical protein [Pandoraea capi]
MTWQPIFVSDMWRRALRCMLGRIALMGLFASPVAFAQSPAPEIHASTFVIEPFVLAQDGRLSGFSIDLWNEVAARLHRRSVYLATPGVTETFQALRAGSADVAVSGLFYSVARDREFDFSYPILEAGLRVMVRTNGQTVASSPLEGVIQSLFSRTSAIWLGVALLLIVVIGHVVWLVERRQTSDAKHPEAYYPGVLRAMYWAATTLLSQADQPPRRWLSRLLAVMWMFVGIIFIASYTAQLTTALTIHTIRGAIEGPGDLPGKRVGTLAGSPAVAYLEQHGALVHRYLQNRDVFRALLDGEVDAVVQGSAGLEYYATHEGRGLVAVVGPEFQQNSVGFVFPVDSPLRKQVNGILLSMREDGSYQAIHDKWFGTR